MAVEARKAAHARGVATTTLPSPVTAEQQAPVVPALRDRVVSLTERRLLEAGSRPAGLPADGRPLPSVAQYDELLAHPPAAAGRGGA